jgi:hypothetical protein
VKKSKANQMISNRLETWWRSLKHHGEDSHKKSDQLEQLEEPA